MAETQTLDQVKEPVAEAVPETKPEKPETDPLQQVKTEQPENPPKKHWWQVRFKKPKTDTAKNAETELPKEPSDSLEANLKAMAAHLEVKERNDYWHIRLNKRLVLIGGGILIILLWVGLAGQRWSQKNKWSINGQVLVLKHKASEISPTPLPQMVIRIRYKPADQATAAAALAEKFKSLGLPVVDTVLDNVSDANGILVVSKASQTALRDRIEGILSEEYQISSPGSELTADSDFDAIILFAPNATQAAKVK